MTQYEVAEPIINSPGEEPAQHWYSREGEQPELRPARYGPENPGVTRVASA